MSQPSGRGSEGYEAVRGRVFILSGPSGVGKDTVTGELKKQAFPLSFCVTATTRPPRPGEIDGVHYFFLDEPTFHRMRDNDELLEWAVVHNHDYGIPRWQVREGLLRGNDIMITVDVQGGETLRRKLPGAIFIFLWPPSLQELERRLKVRASETEQERRLRLLNAEREMEHWKRYDYLVQNDNDRVPQTVESIKSIITAERLRVNPRLVSL